MSNKNNVLSESLSAIMDGEAEALELHRTLKVLNSGPQTASTLRSQWHRYQLAATAMRRELPPQFCDLSASISQAIQAEPYHRTHATRFIQPLGRVAIAASVALAAVVGVQQVRLAAVVGGDQAARAVATAETQNAVTQPEGPQFQLPSGFELPPVNARAASAGNRMSAPEQHPVLVVKQPVPSLARQEEIQRYLNDLMLRHTESAALNANQGMLPYARLPQQNPGGR